ncbi:ATP-dependent DNA helicase [Trichonephila clavipes]|nr:ATP-dependent DNA helicase [Trichonephila clavipes]
MNKKYQSCDAFKWNDETAGMCCSSSKVSLPLLGEPEEPLKTLLLSVTNESKQFLSKIRKCNSCFQMTSFGVDKVIRMPGFSPTFTVERADISSNWITISRSHNVVLKIFKSAIDNWPSDIYKVVIHAARTPCGEYEWRYNALIVNEVAVLVTGELCSPRDVVLRAHDNTLQEWHRRIQGTPVENQPDVKASDALDRVYIVHVTNLECFCLCMLLHHVRGPTSFTELKIVNGQECQTYREACEARRLLENDNHWDETMEEAVQC